LNLYRKLDFGKLHKGNPLIIEVARKMGRTPNSLAMKLCNFASLDPVITASGRKGLPGATPQDKRMWTSFQVELATQGPESEQMLHDLFTRDDGREVDFLSRKKVELEVPRIIAMPCGPTEIPTWRRERRGQQFFRQSVINAYGLSCCVSSINVPRLLVASHIKPWSKCSDAERLDPRNGLCLSSLHDAAFDAGLITFDEKLSLVMSKRLKKHFPQTTLEHNFVPFVGVPIRGPRMIAEPAPAFMHYHRTTVFKD
jgi:putative restriction endonuclease